MANVVMVLYALVLAGLGFFAIHRIKMLWLYAIAARRAPRPQPKWIGQLPFVCVQCPLYNEPLVVEALLEAVTAIRWNGPLEIQILDDSTDSTPQIIERWLQAHPQAATRVSHIRREKRSGYKAGALAFGMERTNAEFFAIFDADFRPEPDFLEHLIPYFDNPKIGVVQARWEFSNRRSSILTRFQGIFLDAHFVIEQVARSSAGFFFNFNGTAGIWRRAALEDAGGWTPDTVTEDLDASYRAQRLGWKFVYLANYSVPSELPENLTAFKSQQHRWTKGGIQVARKQLGSIFQSDLPGRIKREAFNHLTIGFVHPLLVAFSVLFVPYLYLMGHVHLAWMWIVVNPVVVLITAGSTVVLYISGQYFRQAQWREGLIVLFTAPLLLAFGLAMSVTCCVAMLEGLLTKGGEFVRTPKGGRAVKSGGMLASLRGRPLFATVIAIELIIGLGMLLGALYFGHHDMIAIALTLLVKASGFLGLAALSTHDLWPRAVPARI